MSSTERNYENENAEEEEEIEEEPEILYEEFFNYFLPSKKNFLNLKECKNAMRCLGLLITEKELCKMLKLKEKNGTEQIGLKEFMSLCQLKQGKSNIQELEEAFQVFDPEKTGVVSSEKLKHSMSIFKPKMTEEEIEQILSEFGIDSKGDINYENYINNNDK